MLTFFTLGGLGIEEDGKAVSGWASRKAEALLVYLACTRRQHARDALAALFWEDRSQARALGNLSVLLTSLRKQVGPYVTIGRSSIAMNWQAEIWVDAFAFQEEATPLLREATLTRAGLGQLARATERYAGDFLAGFSVRGAPAFEEWALFEQERLQRLLLACLQRLAEACEVRGLYAEGVVHARRLVNVDPLHEPGHRALMRLLAQNGEPAAALAHYEHCREILSAELGVEPEEETQALYTALRERRSLPAPGARPSTPGAPRQDNLPAAATAFLGREAERNLIRQHLANPACRLLSLVGPGGVGKSRLALEAAAEQRGRFLHGVWWVPLAALTDAADLPRAVAAALGLEFDAAAPPLEQLTAYLAQRDLLLVLDNYEQFLDTGDLSLIQAILSRAPGVKLLVTSRERLNAQAEWLLELFGLPTPGVDQPLASSPAAALFLERAARLRPDVAANDADAQAVARICRLVSGLPLALELAAAWVRVLPLPVIADQLERDLALLAVSARDLPPRHRSMEAVLDSAWTLLLPARRDVLRRLAVFQGGAPLAGAQAVAHASLPALAALVDKSFLFLDEHGRYRRHPLVRQYTRTRLAQDPAEEAETRDRHAGFYAAFLEEAHRRLSGPEQIPALQAIQLEMDNIRVAWRWAVHRGRWDLVAAMLDGLERFYDERSLHLEAWELFTWAVDRLEAAGPPGDQQRLWVRLGLALGTHGYRLSRYEAARRRLEQAAVPARQEGWRRELAGILHMQALLRDDAGDYAGATALLEEALTVVAGGVDERRRSRILNSLGVIAWEQGDYAQARRRIQESLAIVQALDDPSETAIRLAGLANVYNAEGALGEAIPLYEQSIARLEEIGNKRVLAAAVHNLAWSLKGLGRFEEALPLVRRGLVLSQEMGNAWDEAVSWLLLGELTGALGDLAAGFGHLRRGVTIAQKAGAESAVAVGVVLAGVLLAQAGRDEAAVACLAWGAAQPEVYAFYKDQAQATLSGLEARLDPLRFTAAQERGRGARGEDLVRQVLAFFDEPD